MGLSTSMLFVQRPSVHETKGEVYVLEEPSVMSLDVSCRSSDTQGGRFLSEPSGEEPAMQI